MVNSHPDGGPSNQIVIIGLVVAFLFLAVVLYLGLSLESVSDGIPPAEPTTSTITPLPVEPTPR